MAFITCANSPSVLFWILLFYCGLGGNYYCTFCYWWDYCCCKMCVDNYCIISSWACGILGCCLEMLFGFWKVYYGGTLGVPSWFKAFDNNSFYYLFPFINWLISGFERTALNCYYTIGVYKFLRICSKLTFPELFYYDVVLCWNPGCWILEAEPYGITWFWLPISKPRSWISCLILPWMLMLSWAFSPTLLEEESLLTGVPWPATSYWRILSLSDYYYCWVIRGLGIVDFCPVVIWTAAWAETFAAWFYGRLLD